MTVDSSKKNLLLTVSGDYKNGIALRMDLLSSCIDSSSFYNHVQSYELVWYRQEAILAASNRPFKRESVYSIKSCIKCTTLSNVRDVYFGGNKNATAVGKTFLQTSRCRSRLKSSVRSRIWFLFQILMFRWNGNCVLMRRRLRANLSLPLSLRDVFLNQFVDM